MTLSPLLHVENLTLAFGTGSHERRVVDSVSFQVSAGETLAVVGESGSGKSVTALSLLRLLPQARVLGGCIHLLGQDMLTLDEDRLRRLRGREASMIFQEPMTSLNPLQTLEKQIGEILTLHAPLSPAEAQTRVVHLLDEVGIPDPHQRLKSYPHQLSGGQRQRVMIAMALANNPKLLIADEPTTALDVTVQLQILRLLKRLQAARGMAIVFITHDLELVHRFADRVVVMQHGRVVETGAVGDVFSAPQHVYTRELLQAEPHVTPPVIPADAPILLEAQDVRVWHPIRKGFLRRVVGHVKAVDGVSLTLRQGSTLGVVGESGSGKTTLGFALLRLLKAEGRVVFMGQDVHALDKQALRSLRRSMQVVFQDPFGSLSPRLDVGSIIAEGLGVHAPHLQAEEREERVVKVLHAVGLPPEVRHRYPHEFSGGQRQRIAIARALVVEPALLVLDEPTSALDRAIQMQVVELLREVQKAHNLTYVFISHDLKLVQAMASDLIVMRHGCVVEAGPAKAIFEDPRQPYTRELLEAAFSREPITA